MQVTGRLRQSDDERMSENIYFGWSRLTMELSRKAAQCF